MKTLFLLFFAITISAQSIEVIETIQLTSESGFTHAKFSHDGEKILFTKAGFNGLYLFEKQNNSIKQINDTPGAGYNAEFTADGEEVIFRSDVFKGLKRYSSIKSQNLENGSINTLVEESRHLSAPMLTTNKLVYTNGENVNALQVSEKTLTKSKRDLVVKIENQKIAIIENGFKTILNPVEGGNYIWSSISPNQEEILFTAAGQGTFICDFEGNILSELGYANAPAWSSNGQWVIYMVDKDDHEQVTESELFAVTKDGSKKIQLTDTPAIHEMYPRWSPKGDEVVFNSYEGHIYLMKIKLN